LNQTYMPFPQTAYYPLSILTHFRIIPFPKTTCLIYLQNHPHKKKTVNKIRKFHQP
jgi:hypothetical protein